LPPSQKIHSNSANVQPPPHLEPEESAISNKAKKPSTEGESDSDDEFNEDEEKLMKSRIKQKDRTKSDQIDFRRASFSDYYKFVKEDLYQHPSADELEIENRIINEEKSQMEMSKMEMSKMDSPVGNRMDSGRALEVFENEIFI